MNSNPDIEALHKKTQARVKGHKKGLHYRFWLQMGVVFLGFWGISQNDKLLQYVSLFSTMGIVLWTVLEPVFRSREDRVLWEEVNRVEGVMFIPLVLDLIVSQSSPPKSFDHRALMKRFFATLKQVKPHHAPLFTRHHFAYVHGWFLQPSRIKNEDDIRYAREVLYFVAQVGNEKSYWVLKKFADNTSDNPAMQELFAYAKLCFEARAEIHGLQFAKTFLLRPAQEPNPDKELLRTIEQEETHHTE